MEHLVTNFGERQKAYTRQAEDFGNAPEHWLGWMINHPAGCGGAFGLAPSDD
jgi:hypothetical protein